MNWNIVILLTVILIIMCGVCFREHHINKTSIIAIITKTQAVVFVVIFLAAITGYLITSNAIKEKDRIYDMKEHYVTVSGRVSKVTESSYGWNLFLEQVELSGTNCSQILVTWEEMPDIKIGNIIKVKGKFKHFEVARNPGNFDSKKYYMSLGIYGKVQASKISVIDSKYDYVRENLYELRIDIQNKLEKICGDMYKGIFSLCNEKAATFSAILLGEKAELSQDVKNLYSISGISHILAISGLHISCIGMFVYSLLRRRFRFLLSASMAMIVVVGFGIMSGLGIATMRAMVMFGLRLLGEVLGRTYDFLTAISMAGIVVLMQNPFAIFNSGFQMSFMAIIAIVIVWPIVCNILQFNPGPIIQMIDENNITKRQRREIWFRNMMHKLLNSVLFCVTINVVLNPIIAYNYFQLPTYSFLLNIVVVPLMSVVLVSGIAGICGSLIGGFIGRVLILPGCAILELYTKLCVMINKLPFANVIVGKPSVGIIIIYYLVIVVFLFAANKIRNVKLKEEKQREKEIGKSGRVIESKSVIKARKRKINCKFITAIIIVFSLLNLVLYTQFFITHYSLFITEQLQATFLDVGQGDGIFIRTGNGVNIMIDGGSTSVDGVGQYRIMPFLKSQCIRKIDYAIVTHADTDHISGLMEMIEESDNNGIRIKNLVMPDIQLKDENYVTLIEYAKEHNVNVLYIQSGDKFVFGDVEINCIYPSFTTKAEDRNDYSTVLSVVYGNFSMLLTGDISTESETEIKNMLERHYTILKVAHHGSKYSTSSEFLQWIKPDYSVISVGENNLYGHPSDETLERLNENGSKVMRTDENGGITVSTDGESMEIENADWNISNRHYSLLIVHSSLFTIFCLFIPYRNINAHNVRSKWCSVFFLKMFCRFHYIFKSNIK